eukprot:3002258-Pyramimonas_sp.AAC.1
MATAASQMRGVALRPASNGAWWLDLRCRLVRPDARSFHTGLGITNVSMCLCAVGGNTRDSPATELFTIVQGFFYVDPLSVDGEPIR